MNKYITVKGAKTNNLKNINVEIPRGKITSVVGVSGAGKNSLTFQTIYAEGYLRYIESISPYIRQFLDKIEKPPLEEIDGLPPAIAFKHKKRTKNPRSIVATSLDIFDYLRILFAKISDFSCPSCSAEITTYSIDEIISELITNYPGKIQVCFEYNGDVAFLINRGYYFYMAAGEKKRIDHQVKNQTIPVLIDSVDVTPGNKSRLFEAVDKSISFGKGAALIFHEGKETRFPSDLYCPKCDIHYEPADEHLFSFNSPKGACPECKGFGEVQELDRQLIFDGSRSIAGGGVRPFNTPMTRRYKEQMIRAASARGIDLHQPLDSLSPEDIEFLLEGDWQFAGVKGFFERVRQKSYKVQARVMLSRYTSYRKCSRCGGSRFKNTALSFKIAGKTIADFLAFSIGEAYDFMRGLDQGAYAGKISADVFRDIEARLAYLVESGLSYIELDRPGFTLSRGEYQRINLAFILGSTLSDSLLIIDQPSSDLHPHDYGKLRRFLHNLKKNDNTVLLVEHNPDVVRYCDYVLELGPLSGAAGGEVVFSGTVEEFFSSPEKPTITQEYFTNKKFFWGSRGAIFQKSPPGRRRQETIWLEFKNACTHNLKNFDFRIPKNTFTVIAGVSGAGKTTLLYDEIYQKNKNLRGGTGSLKGIKEIVFIDPGINAVRARSNVAAFFDFFPAVRELFARQKESKIQGYTAGFFSFNSALGRCESCKGKGYTEIEMQFLPAVEVVCDACRGKGYNQEVLKIKYKGKNIREVLDLTVNGFIELAAEDFPDKQRATLLNIKDNGLGYLHLGQQLKTLSAGELQRLKLLKFLDQQKRNTLFLIDEPSFGLHYYDIEKVKNLIDKILANNNTIAAAEHNMNLIAHAGYILELGHEGGKKGGHLVFQGGLQDILDAPDSLTGIYLKKNTKNT